MLPSGHASVFLFIDTHRPLAHNISFISAFRLSHVHVQRCFMRRRETMFTLFPLQIMIFISLNISNFSTLNRYELFSTFIIHLCSLKQGIFRKWYVFIIRYKGSHSVGLPAFSKGPNCSLHSTKDKRKSSLKSSAHFSHMYYHKALKTLHTVTENSLNI
jgi:hypothetical protein